MTAIAANAFGMHTRYATALQSPQTPWHDLAFKSIRLWDTGTNWRALETSKGVFDFAKLDANIALAVANGCHILMTLGQPPNWATGGTSASGHGTVYNSIPPTSDQDWVDYIFAVVPRLPLGSAYEVWNEPDAADYFYSGTLSRLIELHILAYNTIKAIDPTAIIISGSPSGTGTDYLYAYLAGVAAYTDVVGMHGYVLPLFPEAVIQRLRWVKAIAVKGGLGGKPIWDTESTKHAFKLLGAQVDGPVYPTPLASDPLCIPQALAAAYAARRLICTLIGGVARTYFYGMDYWWSALRLVTDLGNPTTLTDAAIAHRETTELLVGADLVKFRQRPPLYWVDYYRNNVSGRFYWCDDDQTSLVDLSGYASGVDVLGNAITLSAAYSVTHSPVFVISA